MILNEVMAELEALGSEKMRAHNSKHGFGGDNQFGVKMGDIRSVAKKIKTDHELGLQLWKTCNLDARLLATLIMKPKYLSLDEIDQMVRSIDYSPSEMVSQLGDWFISYVVKLHPQKEELRAGWMNDQHPMAARAGWSLTAERAAKNPDGLDYGAVLDRIECEMRNAPAPAQWTMNFALAEIGINHPQHRERAIAIGEKLGVYRDYPVSKGCTSPFAPIWIDFMVSRQA